MTQARALFHSGNILRGFVGYARNRIRVIEKTRVGCVRGSICSRLAFRGPLRRLWLYVGGLVHDFQDLSFDDAADFIEIEPALALDFEWIRIALAKKKIGRYERHERGSRIRKVMTPICESRARGARSGLFSFSQAR